MITDPQIVRLANEQLRPLSEEVRALTARLNVVRLAWFGGLNALVPNDSTLLDDGRDAEGVSRLTGADITNTVSLLISLYNTLEATGVPETVQKPCVRADL